MGWLSRICGLGLVLAGGLAAGVLAAASQEATQPDQPKAQARVTWASSCTSAGRGQQLECAMEQRAIAKENGQVIALITIRVPSDTKKPVSMVQVPLNLFLPAGVNVDVDGDMAQNFPFQTCNNNGCFVGFPVSDNLLKQMLNGGKLNITFQYLNKKPVVLPMSLEGFTEAYNRIK
jgi:invasion protein IalB